MSVHAFQAQQCFDDAKNYVNSKQDPVTWDLVNGLSALAQEMIVLSNAVSQLHTDLGKVQQDVHRLKNR